MGNFPILTAVTFLPMAGAVLIMLVRAMTGGQDSDVAVLSARHCAYEHDQDGACHWQKRHCCEDWEIAHQPAPPTRQKITAPKTSAAPMITNA